MITSPADCTEQAEDGFVIPTTALLLIPLMIFAAFAVDIGAWYARAGQAQRAADAAALAAVVYMPDLAAANTAAQAAAARNGFVDQPGCDVPGPCVNPASYPQVIVTGTTAETVRVNILTEGELYFGSVAVDGPIEIERFAAAQYVLPVELGNPSSALGTGNLGGGGATAENLWLAVNGYCTGRQQGDAISSFYQYTSYYCPGPFNVFNNVPQPWAQDYGRLPTDVPNFFQWTDNGTQPGRVNNASQYDPEGYRLSITMPPGSDSQTWNVDFYDPGVCDRIAEFNFGVPGTPGNDKVPVTLQTTLFRADSTTYDDTDNTTPHGVGTIDWPTNSCDWQTGYTISPSDPRGRYILQYRSRAVTNELGLNYFGVRVTPAGGGGAICIDPLGTSTCPRVAAKTNLPIYVPSRDKTGAPLVAPGSPANFFLAQIDEVHKDKVLEIVLFDPGEGMNNLQIIDPFGNRPPFTFETVDNAEFGYNQFMDGGLSPMTDMPLGNQDDCGGVNCLDTTANRFQNRTVRIRIDLTGTPDICDADCWWQIRYEPSAGGIVTDRTTWTVRVVGDPVRLIE